MGLELRESRNPVFELPFPIVPEFRSRIRPVPRRVRNKGFSVPTLRGKSVHSLMDEKVKTLKYRVNAGTWPCATHVNERCVAALWPPFLTHSSADVFLDRYSSPLATTMHPAHAIHVPRQLSSATIGYS